jgi:hypothetical protein
MAASMQFVPLAMRIGLDAVKRLNAKPRELPVTCYDSSSSPCLCFADGIALATMLRSDAHGLFWVRANRIEPCVLPQDEA